MIRSNLTITISTPNHSAFLRIIGTTNGNKIKGRTNGKLKYRKKVEYQVQSRWLISSVCL